MERKTAVDTMMTFKNKNLAKRDYECTNVVACQAERAPDENWIPCEDSIIDSLTHIETVAGVRYYGWL